MYLLIYIPVNVCTHTHTHTSPENTQVTLKSLYVDKYINALKIQLSGSVVLDDTVGGLMSHLTH